MGELLFTIMYGGSFVIVGMFTKILIDRMELKHDIKISNSKEEVINK